MKKIKNDIIMKHVDLIIEGLTKMPKNKQAAGVYMQILLIATFLSFINDIEMEVENGNNFRRSLNVNQGG